MLQSLVDTKKDIGELLQDILSVPISERIYKIYTANQKQGLKKFQQELQEISKWNNYIIEQETKEITKNISYDISHLLNIYIKTCLKIKFFEYHKKINHMNTMIPSLEDFIHRCLVNVSDFAWKHAYLFTQSLKSVEIQNNMNIIEFNIKKIINKTLNQYVNGKTTIEYLNRLLNKSVKKTKKDKAKSTKTNNENQIQNSSYETEELAQCNEISERDAERTDDLNNDVEEQEYLKNEQEDSEDAENEEQDAEEEQENAEEEQEDTEDAEDEEQDAEEEKEDTENVKDTEGQNLITNDDSSDDMGEYEEIEKSQDEIHTVNFQSDRSSSDLDSEPESLSSDEKNTDEDLNVKIVKIDNEINEKKKKLSFFTNKHLY